MVRAQADTAARDTRMELVHLRVVRRIVKARLAVLIPTARVEVNDFCAHGRPPLWACCGADAEPMGAGNT